MRSDERLTIAICAPSEPSRWATPRLMPLDAPTTTALRPDKHWGSRAMLHFLIIAGEDGLGACERRRERCPHILAARERHDFSGLLVEMRCKAVRRGGFCQPPNGRISRGRPFREFPRKIKRGRVQLIVG